VCCLALQLEELQSRLLDVGSAVATPIPSSSEAKLQRVAFDPGHTAKLEAWIDEMNESLPPLTQFILPSGALLLPWLA
jgi:cob(I)alamin adenosyltransferase